MNASNLKDRVSMYDVLDMYGLGQPNKANKICCPFHQERTPSCWIQKKKFHCFGCGADGDIYKFVMLMDGHNDFKRAFQKLGGEPDKKPLSDSSIAGKLKIQRIRQERERLESQLENLNTEYIETCNQLNYCRKAIETLAPKTPEDFENVSGIYADALKRVDFLENQAQHLFEELDKLRKEKIKRGG